MRFAIAGRRVDACELIAADHLGQPPIKHHHFAEITEHHVPAFQVTMHDVARMGIAHGIADAHEGASSARKSSGPASPLARFL